MQQLGVGTYGEVHRCVHLPSGIDVAMKTFKFDVRRENLVNLSVERSKRYQLLYYEGDIHS